MKNLIVSILKDFECGVVFAAFKLTKVIS